MFLIRYSLCVIFTLACVHAVAGVINNGDFSSGTPLDGFSPSGSVTEPTGNFAQIDDSGFLTQEFEIPSLASKLSFDFAFSTSSPSGSSTGFDSFAAELTTTSDKDVLDVFFVDLSGVTRDPLDGIEAFFPGVVPIDVVYLPSDTFPGFQGVPNEAEFFAGRISLLLPSEVLGENAKITFELSDQDSGAQTRAALDNVSISTDTGVIPEPSSFALWLGSATLLVLRRSRRRSNQLLSDT